jgi:hypothetical protein
MKACIFALIGLVVLSHASSVMNSQAEATTYFPDFSVSGDTSDLNEFLDGVFDYMNITAPNVLSCFNDASADAVFQTIDFFGKSYNTILSMNQEAKAALQSEGEYLQGQLGNAGACLKNMSSSLMYLAMVFSPEQMATMKLDDSLFMIVDQQLFSNAFSNVISLIQEKEYYNAGADLISIFTQISINVVNATGVNTEEWEAFLTGMFQALNLTEPLELFECYSSDDAEVQIEFYAGWAAAIANVSDVANVFNATNTYFESDAVLLGSIPSAVKNCQVESSDIARFSQALGMNYTSPQFGQDLFNFISSNNLNNDFTYSNNFIAMNGYFKNENYAGAGTAFGTFLYAVAQANL